MTLRNTAEGIAIVTGASGGMGAASARALAEAGYEELLLCDLDADEVAPLASHYADGGMINSAGF